MGQADLIFTMVSLEVLVQQQQMKEKKIGRYYSCLQYKTRFKTEQVGRDDEGS